MWEDVFVWKRGKAGVLQVKNGWKWIQDLRRQLFSSFPADHLYAASMSICILLLYSTSELNLQIVSLFWWVLCSVLFLCSSDTFLWMAVHHWCCWILWSQKHVCSLRPLLVRKPSVLCAFFLSVNSFKDIQKKELWRLPSCAIGRIHALAEVKGCLVWNSAAAVNLLRLPDIPSFTWWLCWSTKRKWWRLRSALALLLTHQEANTKLGKLFRVPAVVCLFNMSFFGYVKIEGNLTSSLMVPVAVTTTLYTSFITFFLLWLLSCYWAKPKTARYLYKPGWCCTMPCEEIVHRV